MELTCRPLGYSSHLRKRKGERGRGGEGRGGEGRGGEGREKRGGEGRRGGEGKKRGGEGRREREGERKEVIIKGGVHVCVERKDGISKYMSTFPIQ